MVNSEKRMDRDEGRLSIAVDGAKFRWNTGVDNADALAMQQLQQSLGFVVGHDEFDLDGHVRRQLEEVLVVQDARPSVTGNRAKRRAAANTQHFGLFEQPLVQGDARLLAILMNVKAQQLAVHRDSPFARRARNRLSAAAVIALPTRRARERSEFR